jgi:hypothetical protein
VETVEYLVFRFELDIERRQSQLQLPQAALDELLLKTSGMSSVADKAAQLWVDLAPGDSSSSSSECDDTDGEASGPGNRGGVQDAIAVENAAIRRWRWVLNAEDCRILPLGVAMQRWADAVCAALPSRRCCSNPRCVVLREMSESNLVNGKACCCGGCSAADQAVRYCSRDCQASHWQQHKALCKGRRRQQQQQ